MLLKNITSSNWQLSPTVYGKVDEGIDDINSCIGNALKTPLGSDCLRPWFGSGIYKFVDKPLNQSIPSIMKEITDAVKICEKRIILTKVTFTLNPDLAKVPGGNFSILWQLSDSDLTGLYSLLYPFSDVIKSNYVQIDGINYMDIEGTNIIA